MTAIKILRGCGASGASLTAGAEYAVPAEVSEKDAAILVRLGKAEYVEPGQPEDVPAKPVRAKKAAA